MCTYARLPHQRKWFCFNQQRSMGKLRPPFPKVDRAFCINKCCSSPIDYFFSKLPTLIDLLPVLDNCWCSLLVFSSYVRGRKKITVCCTPCSKLDRIKVIKRSVHFSWLGKLSGTKLVCTFFSPRPRNDRAKRESSDLLALNLSSRPHKTKNSLILSLSLFLLSLSLCRNFFLPLLSLCFILSKCQSYSKEKKRIDPRYYFFHLHVLSPQLFVRKRERESLPLCWCQDRTRCCMLALVAQ